MSLRAFRTSCGTIYLVPAPLSMYFNHTLLAQQYTCLVPSWRPGMCGIDLRYLPYMFYIQPVTRVASLDGVCGLCEVEIHVRGAAYKEMQGDDIARYSIAWED